ncbi:Small-conductance mechanosensitive channel [Polaribacter huanghezhanensis]|uniref:mechanosensitive ion channel family protein n=1 Tax=Polaribacter huanghezhanensis TaxID=1354726 RepID=UPI00264A36F5|nr:mechanosensitive ion channel family protein [Polaribacter huanghezhanensis]WKD85045.1 Small-conductance mechanosensitive channel [Polaribacter huanghezhanensis]
MIHKYFTEFRTESMIVVIILSTIFIATLFNWLMHRLVKKSLIEHHKDLTGYLFIKHIITALIYIIGLAFALVQIPEFKIVGHSLLAGAGVLSLIAGLASQQALSNVMSGILIVIFKPFRINDKITLRGTFTGVVEDINLRQVVIRDFENNRIIIPNSVISSDLLVNAHLGDNRCCKFIDIGIGYSSNTERALEIMKEEVLSHPLHIDNRTQEDIDKGVPPVIARVTALGDSAVNLRVAAWAKDSSDAYGLYCDLLQSIKNRFDNEGIEIPFPQRSVTLNNPNINIK